MFQYSIIVVTAFLLFGLNAEPQCGHTEVPPTGVIPGKDFPWIAEIVSSKNGLTEFVTGMGALIDKRHVITVQNVAENLLRIKPKAVHLAGIKSRSGKKIAISHIDIVNLTVTDDVGKPGIAILTLAEPAEDVMPICLPSKDERFSETSYHYVSYNIGFGSLHPEHKFNKYLSELKAVEFGKCLEFYTRYNFSTELRSDIHICAGDKHEDSCTGEAGSPLMQRDPSGAWKVIALSYFGPSSCGTGVPSVFTNVVKQADRIHRIINHK